MEGELVAQVPEMVLWTLRVPVLSHCDFEIAVGRRAVLDVTSTVGLVLRAQSEEI